MSTKQVFLPILLLLSFEIMNNSTLTFAKQQKSAGFHYITGQFFFFFFTLPKIPGGPVIYWCLPGELRVSTSPGEQVY